MDFGRVGRIVSGKSPYRTDCTFMVIGNGLHTEVESDYRMAMVVKGMGFISEMPVMIGEIGAVNMNADDIEWLDDPQP